MEVTSLQQLIEGRFSNAQVRVDGDGSGHYIVEIVSDEFEGMSRVKRQQAVYACIGEHIASGDIHAVTIRTHTQIEFKNKV